MSTASSVAVDGTTARYLTADRADAPAVLLVHGTYWSRVWLPVLDGLAEAGLRPVAVDLPGLGRSAGELTPESAAVPELAAWVARFAAALGLPGPLRVVGHDIGGAVAQHLLVGADVEVDRLALVNSVTYDSWPVPAVARFRDPAVRAAVTVEELLAARRTALTAALGRPASEAEIAEYLEPWTDPRVARSWLCLAAAADSRHTLSVLPELVASPAPKLLVWGEDDRFQPVSYAERFAAEVPGTTLVRVPGAGHIPMENDPEAVVGALAPFLTAHSN
ncbi:alpha/beta fold hydrolase [Streptomyces millisiae]|uniref:Alpha/beta hydrolase n=1 Tax=Streptomyces millisiae TaxID=3075542 RepID=A0ABU2LI79_9ACTN|nr:alpha/beta hydrolase [Streptomyces sp. DSM 44918]MDT0317284.1 alpha/beta hydrolase [Streptomyces sp. DSM 44918]